MSNLTVIQEGGQAPQTFNFEGHPVRIFMRSGDPWFVAADLCKALNLKNSRVALMALGDDEKGVSSTYTLGGEQQVAVVSEGGMWTLVLRCRDAVIEGTVPHRMRRWVTSEVLPSIRRGGSYARKMHESPAPVPLRDQVDAGILLLRAVAEDLKLAPSALLGGYQQLESRVGVAGLLPAYAVDAPTSSATGSSEETRSLGELLDIHGVGLSAIAFNRLLMQHGFLVERERPSSKGCGTKKFKVCVNLEFGKNLTSTSNPRETQPHWYVAKFAELVDLVVPPRPRVAAA